MQRNYRVFKNPFALLVLTSESILCSSLAPAPLPGLCCSAWQDMAWGDSHTSNSAAPAASWCAFEVLHGAQLSREFYTPFTPFPRSESEKILLQGALRTQCCKQLWIHYFMVILCGSVEPGVWHSWGACPAAVCKNNTGSCLWHHKVGLEQFHPSAVARCSFGHCSAL